jgi:hypothetical protein
MWREKGPSVLKENAKFVVWGSVNVRRGEKNVPSLYAPFAVNGRDKVNMKGEGRKGRGKKNSVEDPSQIYIQVPLRVRTKKARALCCSPTEKNLSHYFRFILPLRKHRPFHRPQMPASAYQHPSTQDHCNHITPTQTSVNHCENAGHLKSILATRCDMQQPARYSHFIIRQGKQRGEALQKSTDIAVPTRNRKCLSATRD